MCKTPPMANGENFNMATILTTAHKRPTYTFSFKETVKFWCGSKCYFQKVPSHNMFLFPEENGDISLKDGIFHKPMVPWGYKILQFYFSEEKIYVSQWYIWLHHLIISFVSMYI